MLGVQRSPGIRLFEVPLPLPSLAIPPDRHWQCFHRLWTAGDVLLVVAASSNEEAAYGAGLAPPPVDC